MSKHWIPAVKPDRLRPDGSFRQRWADGIKPGEPLPPLGGIVPYMLLAVAFFALAASLIIPIIN